jgi:hypothetical protein
VLTASTITASSSIARCAGARRHTTARHRLFDKNGPRPVRPAPAGLNMAAAQFKRALIVISSSVA